ncbi:MAG: tyrosine-type recombinase/integrase, partial [Limosilactobacillus sp.]|uniref:tyrosine-type recombinase/integrase n=1 Tax=Limosilactobacillus sp. TaxID=2773925 RepID=UPI0027024852|nr:tyrosine-type recombinase/integrase [Limosilactobacillus sp.]
QSTLAKDIKKRDFQLFINSLSPRYSTSTINLVVKAIRNLVKLAVSDHVISENFTTGIMQPKKTDRTIEYLNTEELSKLTRYITNNLNPEYRADYIILTAIYTGARLGEILGLTWEDINFNFKTITINKAWNHTTKSISTTKNTSSNRTIPVNDELLSALKQLKVNHTQYLFLENHVSYSVIVNTRLRKLLTTCNIEKQSYHFHSLRHTHVAYLLANNIPLAVIAKRLGHANTTTTANTYAYLIEEFEDKTNRDILNSLGVLNGVPTSKLSNTANNRK